MNDIREIVTKAIVERGKQSIRFTEKIETKNPAESVLGCWVLNHRFQASRIPEGVLVEGTFETHIWYSHHNNSQTEVSKEIITYQQEVKTKQKVKDYSKDNTDVIVRMIQPPVCSDVKIEDNYIEIEILLEVAAEVIGETKIRVNVLDPIPTNDDEEDGDMNDEIDGQINPHFLREKIF